MDLPALLNSRDDNGRVDVYRVSTVLTSSVGVNRVGTAAAGGVNQVG